MPTRKTLMVFACCFIIVLTASLQHDGGVRAMALEYVDPARIWVIPIHGTVDLGMAEFVRRTTTDALRNNADVILLDINTLGGRVDAAIEIRDHLMGVPVHTVAFISKRAISAGALIALSANSIIMAPGATMGAAQPSPLDTKVLSYVRAEFASTAASQGRNERIAEAMVDADIAIDGLVASGEILTLTAQQAIEHAFIDFIAENTRQAISVLGYEEAIVDEQSMTFAEQVLRFLTEPIVAQILLTIGLLGLLVEITSPGWGVPGSLGLVSLVLFFGSRFVVGILSFGVIVLFVVGLILLFIELFVTPGFGVVGFFGIIAIATSLFLSFSEPIVALQALAITGVASTILITLFLRRFHNAALWGGLVLKESISDTVEQSTAPVSTDTYMHAYGKAVTPLRPSGKVQIHEEIFDAVSEGRFIQKGQQVQVIRVERMRVVVRPVSTLSNESNE